MRAQRALVLSFLLALLVASACDDGTGLGPTVQSMELTNHVDLGCVHFVADAAVPVPDLEGAQLVRFEVVDDTLRVGLLFDDQCCADFEAFATYNPGRLEIELYDTGEPCDCICPFNENFDFVYEGSGWIHLVFRTCVGQTIPPMCTTRLDTIVCVP